MYISKNILSSYMHKILHKILWLLPVLINYFSTRWQFYRFRKYVINMPPYNAIYWHNIWSSDQQKISIASRTKCLVFSHRFYTIRNWYILLIMFFYIIRNFFFNKAPKKFGVCFLCNQLDDLGNVSN